MIKSLTALSVFLGAVTAQANTNMQLNRICMASGLSSQECASLYNFVVAPIESDVFTNYGIELHGRSNMSFRPRASGEVIGDFTLSGAGISCTYPLVRAAFDGGTIVKPIAMECGCVRQPFKGGKKR